MFKTIWLLTAYGAIPGEAWRESRSTAMARTLAEYGHNVVFWTSNFSHRTKQVRPSETFDVLVQPRLLLRQIPSTTYSANISLARMLYELVFSLRVYKRAVDCERPDLIIVAEPPAILGYIGTRLSKHFGCPIVSDVIDLWPEQFVIALPRLVKRFSPLLFYPLYSFRRRNLRAADGIVANSDSCRSVCFKEAPGLREKPNATIATGVNGEEFRNLALTKRDVTGTPVKCEGDLWAVYAGTLGHNYDIPTLLAAARICHVHIPHLRIIIAGNGPLLDNVLHYIEESRNANITYLGVLSHQQVASLYSSADIGLCVYGSESTVAIPDKAYDYMAAGLPIINSLTGEFAEILRNHDSGLQYSAGDPQSLADALIRLSQDQRGREVMARKSYEASLIFDSRVQYGVLPKMVNAVLEGASRECGASRTALQDI